MSRHTLSDLYQMQSLPLSAKIRMTQERIRAWYDHWDGNVYVSFSAGKDSTVLLDICREMYPDIKAVYFDTGLEFPSVRRFATSHKNVEILKPKMSFKQTIIKYGYPVISKEICETLYYAKKWLTNNGYISNGITNERTNERTNDGRVTQLGRWRICLE